MGISAYLIVAQDTARVSLRRYTHWDSANSDHFHQAQTLIGYCACRIVDSGRNFRDRDWVWEIDAPVMPGRADPRWPKACLCGHRFTEQDEWQVFTESLYQRVDNGELTTIRDAPPGAMYDAWWYWRTGPDGLSLVVLCPNGASWWIDGHASNCTQPDDELHRCWVRHGTPPQITVDKNGLTCQAGAGSIQAGDYHGFLQGGVFT